MDIQLKWKRTPRSAQLQGWAGGFILLGVIGELVVGLATWGAVAMLWARPDLMVLLLIAMGAGIYGWRHPDLDDWRGH